MYWALERLIVPTLRHAQFHYYTTLKEVVARDCSWLDLGCGHQMFNPWMKSEEQEISARSKNIVGIDLNLDSLQRNVAVDSKVLGSLEHLPFHSDAFDLITSNMVVEHVMQPRRLLDEVYRVLRPGGVFVFHTPNVRSVMARVASLLPDTAKRFFALTLEEREASDVFPTFYRMNTPGAIQADARESGFEVTNLRTMSSTAITAMLPVLSAFELFYLRILEMDRFSGFRSNLIVHLRKPPIWKASVGIPKNRFCADFDETTAEQ